MTLLLWLALQSKAQAQSQPEALKCVEKFFARMASLKGYSAEMTKGEMYNGKWNEEPIGLYSEGPEFIKYTFLKPGLSGVKNNGMSLLYKGAPELEIEWGQPRGLGVFTNRAARAVAGRTIASTDKSTLKGELFTLKRAGYHHIFKSLRHHWAAIKAAKSGGLSGGSDCRLRYTPPTQEYTTVHLTPSERIDDLEDRFGNYAFHIRQANKDQFGSLYDLFHRTKDVDVRVPEFLMPFEVDIDPSTSLPTRFLIELGGEKAGEYTFTKIKAW